VHLEQVAGVTALGTRPVSYRLDDDYAAGPLSLWHAASTPVRLRFIPAHH
jgi:hypothetical protein